MNLSLLEREVWGSSVTLDSLSNFFLTNFESKGLVDVQPLKVEPTWNNNRSVEQSIYKRLGRFLISENLMSGPLTTKTWVEAGGLLYHLPIILPLEKKELKLAPPFRFNPSWQQEDEYRKIVMDTCSHLDDSSIDSYMK